MKKIITLIFTTLAISVSGQNADPSTFPIADSSIAAGKMVYTGSLLPNSEYQIPVDSIPIWFGQWVFKNSLLTTSKYGGKSISIDSSHLFLNNARIVDQKEKIGYNKGYSIMVSDSNSIEYISVNPNERLYTNTRNFYEGSIQLVDFPFTGNFTVPMIGIDGQIYVFPRSSQGIIEINPITLKSKVIPNANSFQAAFAHSNGLIYAIRPGIISVFNPITKEILDHSHGTGGAFFEFVEYNEYVYLFPLVGNTVIKIDINTNVISTAGTFTDQEAGIDFFAGTESANGAFYYIPYKAERVYKYDLATETFALIGSTFAAQGDKWAGCKYNPLDSCIYAMPYSRGTILKINTKTDITTEISSPYTNGAQVGFSCAFSIDGRFYFMSSDNNASFPEIGIFDPVTETTTFISNPVGYSLENTMPFLTLSDGRMLGINGTISKIVLYNPPIIKKIHIEYIQGSHNNKI